MYTIHDLSTRVNNQFLFFSKTMCVALHLYLLTWILKIGHVF